METLKIGEYIYYRRTGNPADNLTLYRFPVDELQRYGLAQSEVPYLKAPSEDADEEELEKFEALERDFPEEVLFSLEDLVEYYRDFALADERIKDFVERIKEFVEL